MHADNLGYAMASDCIEKAGVAGPDDSEEVFKTAFFQKLRDQIADFNVHPTPPDDQVGGMPKKTPQGNKKLAAKPRNRGLEHS